MKFSSGCLIFFFFQRSIGKKALMVNKNEEKASRVQDQEGVKQSGRVTRPGSYSMVAWQH